MAQAREHKGVPQRAVAKALGLSQGTISEAETEAEGSAHVTRFAAYYGVSAEWLATGVGEMLAQPGPQAFSTRMSTAAVELALQFDEVPVGRQRALYARLQDLIRRAKAGYEEPAPGEPPTLPRGQRPQKEPL